MILDGSARCGLPEILTDMTTIDIYVAPPPARRHGTREANLPSATLFPVSFGAAALSLSLLSPAYANNECGAVVGGTVTCNPSTYTVGPNNSIQYPNQNGLTATISGVTVQTRPRRRLFSGRRERSGSDHSGQ